MLRAVLKRDDCRQLADPSTLVYLGEEFPNLSQVEQDARDFALLRVSAEEADSQWKCGYYRLDADLMELNARLLFLAT